MQIDFTYKSYVELINVLHEKGYQITDYHSVDDFEKQVILRHDVDFDLDKAVKMAMLEKELQVHSTYFILLSTDFYNIHSKNSLAKVEEILSCGHHIGLHFDELKYKDRSIENLKQKIKQEVKFFNMELGENVIRSISMHRPSKEILASNLQIDGCINSYSKRFFEDYKYVSDSRMNWREDVFSIILSKKYPKLHILTHPFWYSEEVETIQFKLKSFLEDSISKRYEMIEENFTNLFEVLEKP